MPDCGVHYLWFAFVCFLIRSPPPPPPPSRRTTRGHAHGSRIRGSPVRFPAMGPPGGRRVMGTLDRGAPSPARFVGSSREGAPQRGRLQRHGCAPSCPEGRGCGGRTPPRLSPPPPPPRPPRSHPLRISGAGGGAVGQGARLPLGARPVRCTGARPAHARQSGPARAVRRQVGPRPLMPGGTDGPCRAGGRGGEGGRGIKRNLVRPFVAPPPPLLSSNTSPPPPPPHTRTHARHSTACTTRAGG